MINQNWVFGHRAGLDFTTNVPIASGGFAIDTFEGCASVSDVNGNLLFYTDGLSIWDSSHTQVVTGLNGDSSSTQSSIIVPDPASSNRYYVLTMDGSSNAAPPFNHFDGVLLDVTTWVATPISSFTTLPPTAAYSPCEKLTAIVHPNCKDFWVVTILQKGADNPINGGGILNSDGIFRVFKIDAAGITHIGDTAMNIAVFEAGYLKASPDGKTLALANGTNGTVNLYPFDNLTGAIDVPGTSTIVMPTFAGFNRYAYGVEFSPNSQVLYYTNLSSGTQDGYVHQVDLNDPLLPSVLAGQVNNLGQRYAIGAVQRGIDGRIYVAKDGEAALAAILDPNVLGTGCNFTDNYILLPEGVLCYLGLPNLLPNPCDEGCDCGCGCHGCNEDAEAQNEELIERAKAKYFTQTQAQNCDKPFDTSCETALQDAINLAPCFHFHWGEGSDDQFEEHDTEVFYLTVCNPFSDLQYNGLRITKITLVPDIHPIEKIQIVPDRFVVFDCLEACTCQTREFALITRANDTAGNYTMDVEYCYEGISLSAGGGSGTVRFDVKITED